MAAVVEVEVAVAKEAATGGMVAGAAKAVTVEGVIAATDEGGGAEMTAAGTMDRAIFPNPPRG